MKKMPGLAHLKKNGYEWYWKRLSTNSWLKYASRVYPQQCDQKARLLLKIWLFYINENFPNEMQN